MENTAKNFALQLGSLITLYISIGAFIGLLFGIVTVQFPDEAQGYWEYESATSSIRFTIAMLVVFFPAYITLTRFVNVIRRTEHGTYLMLTKWLIYLSLIVAGGALLGDFVAVLNGFLEGELTVRFALKALTVLLVVGTAFTYYLLDARAYWQANEKHSLYYAIVVSGAVIISLIAGFMHTETPSEVRNMRLDQKQISDLQDMQYRIEAYISVRKILPETLEQAYGELDLPVAPEGRASYSYSVLSTESFKLCAEFASSKSISDSSAFAEKTLFADPLTIKNPNDWDYAKGEWCFTRVLNSTR